MKTLEQKRALTDQQLATLAYASDMIRQLEALCRQQGLSAEAEQLASVDLD